MKFIDFKGAPPVVPLGRFGAVDDQVHIFKEADVAAVNGALAAGRPLLVKGEPGVGKSQLARAAAKHLERAFVECVVDSLTESRDLLWTLDSIRRLGKAQIAGALAVSDVKEGSIRDRLALENFLSPGPLWWALNWQSAQAAAAKSGTPAPPGGEGEAWRRGVVVLVDEIDKAESETPDGLLEILGSGRFTPPDRTEPVRAVEFPLVIITTNGERSLPDAFIRRCFVLALDLPKDDSGLKALLIERGQAHFPAASDDVLRLAADMLASDRRAAGDRRPRPGQAEYLDLLRAVLTLYEGDEPRQREALRTISEFTLRKYAHLDD